MKELLKYANSSIPRTEEEKKAQKERARDKRLEDKALKSKLSIIHQTEQYKALLRKFA